MPYRRVDEEEINGTSITIYILRWFPNSMKSGGNEMPTEDYPPEIRINDGTRIVKFKKGAELSDLLPKLKNRNEDVEQDGIKLPRGSLGKISKALEARANKIGWILTKQI